MEGAIGSYVYISQEGCGAVALRIQLPITWSLPQSMSDSMGQYEMTMKECGICNNRDLIGFNGIMGVHLEPLRSMCN